MPLARSERGRIGGGSFSLGLRLELMELKIFVTLLLLLWRLAWVDILWMATSLSRSDRHMMLGFEGKTHFLFLGHDIIGRVGGVIHILGRFSAGLLFQTAVLFFTPQLCASIASPLTQ